MPWFWIGLAVFGGIVTGAFGTLFVIDRVMRAEVGRIFGW